MWEPAPLSSLMASFTQAPVCLLWEKPVSVSPLGADVFPMNGWAARSEKGISESEPVSARALAEQNLKPEG